jgi:DNA-directed RNA polymerase beta' subunit
MKLVSFFSLKMHHYINQGNTNVYAGNCRANRVVSNKKIAEFVEKNLGRATNSKLIMGPKDLVHDKDKEHRSFPSLARRTQPQDLNFTSKDTPMDKVARERHQNITEKLSQLPRCVPCEYSLSYMSPDEMKGSAVFSAMSMSTANDAGTSGIFDKRLAPDKRTICLTCSRNYKGCEQHRAYIPFHKPFVNPLCQEEVIYILKSTCGYCGQVYATDDFIKMMGYHKISDRKKYLKLLSELTSKIHTLHSHEGWQREIFDSQMKNHLILFVEEGDPSTKKSKWIENVIRLFDNLNENSLRILRFTGSNHPRNLILHGILTLPTNLHLPVMVNGKLTEHFYTTKYVGIIDCNIKMRQAGDDKNVLDDLQATQYTKLKEIFNGPEANAAIKMADKEVGICKGFGRKGGIIRKHMQGKRVDDCARTVANPSIYKYGYIGVPRKYVSILTVKVKATKYNLVKIQNDIRNGEYKHFFPVVNGAPILKAFDEKIRKTHVVEIGCEYERSLRDGDIVLNGRQPTLHGPSIMGYKVYLHDDRVFKVHLSNVGPMNCDFDGDEITIHVPQTITAQVEAETIMNTEYHLMNEQANRPMIGLAFHALVFGFLATKTWRRNEEQVVILSRDRFIEGLSLFPDNALKESLFERCQRQGVDTNSGNALMSILFPETFNFMNKRITIKNGIIIDGTLTQEMLSPKKESLIEKFKKEFKIQDVSWLVGGFNKLRNWFIKWRRFSLGEFEVEIPERRMIAAMSRVDNSPRKKTLKRRCKQYNINPLSGRALASLPFPVNFTFSNSNVTIRDGILIKGYLNKASLGTGHASLIGELCRLYSMEEANRFIDEFATLGNWFIMWHRLSLGMHTFSTNRIELHKKNSNDINSVQARFFNLGPLPKDDIDIFFWKRRAHNMLNESKKNARDIGNNELTEANALNILGSNGAQAKGSDMNTAQITGFLGIQNIKGDLQIKEMNGGTRGLPMFLPNDCALEAHGFITKSFYDGIDESGLYDHLAASREGQVDTAHSTKDIGYTHRRIEKGMENTIFGGRGFIETVLGKIFQFTYDCLNVAMEVNVHSDEMGKHLCFVNFAAQADLLNRLYEYIDERGDAGEIPQEFMALMNDNLIVEDEVGVVEDAAFAEDALK